MNKKNKNKTKKLIVLFSLLFSLILVNFGSILIKNWNNSDNLNDFNPIHEDDTYQFEEIPTSSQALNYSGSGELMDITIHQSYLNNSFNTPLNASDLNNNSIYLPSPKNLSFNSTFTNITIQDIYAPDKTLIVEDNSLGVGFENFYISNYYASFTPKGVGYLENISLLIKLVNIADHANLTIRLYNSENDGGNIRPLSNLGTIVGVSNVTSDTYYWHKITNIHALFNCSETYNDTFFLRVGTIGGSVSWDWSNDVGSDGVDEMIALDAGETLLQFLSNTIDLTLKTDLSPLSNTPKPSEIGLKINNTEVSNEISNSGYWFKENQEYSDLDGDLEFEITADWWDVTCEISQVQINYTKTDVKATSSFNIMESSDFVQWNVTVPTSLNYFDSRIDHFNTINFTIPSTWIDTTIKVFNGSTDKTSDLVKRLVNSQYREIQVLNAGNGTFWYLTANSTNLLSSIDTYISNIPISASYIANFTSDIEFNATFSEFVNDGSLNLSVYSPIPHHMNNTVVLPITSGNSGSEILVDIWDVSADIRDYGVFLVQMSWNNDTAAAYLEKYITIFADTQSATIPTTIPKNTFNASNIFDLEVHFNDTIEGIDGATLNYSINGGSIRGDNIDYTRSSTGYYNITIDCDDPQFANYGPNTIDLNISKQYYNNQTESFTFTIIGETESMIIRPSDSSVFNSTKTIILTLFYNDTVKDLGINNANINYTLDGGLTYRHDGITPFGQGRYNISISAYDNDFNGYGVKTIIVNSSKLYYHNQSNSVTIKILGETSLSYLKIPDKAYYNSSETFNISVYYGDFAKSSGISGATIEIEIDGTPFLPTIYDNLDGWYNITFDCSNAIFSTYTNFGIRINVSKSYYYNDTKTLNTVIVGNVSLAVLSPSEDSVYVEGDNFVIRVEYYDTILSTGIDVATIAYSLNDGTSYNFTGVVDNTDGTYDISIYTGDSAFLRYGFVDIIINASKHLYENSTITYTFHRQINTDITPFNDFDLGSIRRGLNVTYMFNYADDTAKAITQANMIIIDAQGFGYYLQNHGNGNYTIQLDSTNVVVGDDHVFIFNISSIGNETQTLRLTIDVTIKDTDVAYIEYYAEIIRYTGENQSISFYFNDTTNTEPVLGLTTNNIVLRNYETGTLWTSGDFWLVDSWNNGTYILEVDMGTRISGWYTLEVNVSKFPDYDISIFLVTFYFRGNNTQINLISLAMPDDPEGPLSPSGVSNYTIFEESNLDINFYLNDTDYLNNLVIGDADIYSVSFFNHVTSVSGVLSPSINFQTQSHVGSISTSDLAPGRYLITITTTKINYENASFAFNLTIIEKYQVRLISVYQPLDVDAGNAFTLIIRAEYFNGTDWLPIDGSEISIAEQNGLAVATINQIATNGTGESEFEITVNINALNMNLNVSLQTAFYHQSTSIPIANIEINPAFSFADLIPYFILFGALLAGSVISVAVYRGAILPKKREKQRILTEVKTIFDDAINLEHILVLYKGTGTCVYFKSYGSEEVDPELIGGFLSAVSSFGKEMVAQEALNEISYGDKMLLLADGVYIRVALVLGKKGSLILRRNLKRFIEAFENTYKDILPKWRGQLNHFMSAGQIVDDLLNTSIILPHQISYDFSNIKDLKISHSKEILKVAHNCCEEADRKFFFIATLLKEAAESTNKDTAEIFIGIKELRDKRMLIPIEISTIEAQPISQQEINLISQKVSQLASLTNEEKQKLVSDLSQVGPAEREAYLASFSTHQEIVSAPIKSKVGTTVIEDKKTAKKQLKILTKAASNLKNKKDYPKSIETYRRAAVIASNWELPNEFIKLEEDIRKTSIEDLQYQKKIEELEAKEALKKKDYAKSAVKFKEASRIASEIFKLGVTDMMKEVKRLTNKANEMDKLK